LTGADQGSSTLSRVAVQMSWPPAPPARFDENTISRLGQKSSEDELIGSGRSTGAPHGSLVLALVATQMSSPPLPPPRFRRHIEAQPVRRLDRAAVLSRRVEVGVVPRDLVDLCAGLHAENCIALAAAAVTPMRIVAATTDPRIRCIAPPSVVSALTVGRKARPNIGRVAVVSAKACRSSSDENHAAGTLRGFTSPRLHLVNATRSRSTRV
jgi:hypothetical protein